MLINCLFPFQHRSHFEIKYKKKTHERINDKWNASICFHQYSLYLLLLCTRINVCAFWTFSQFFSFCRVVNDSKSTRVLMIVMLIHLPFFHALSLPFTFTYFISSYSKKKKQKYWTELVSLLFFQLATRWAKSSEYIVLESTMNSASRYN